MSEISEDRIKNIENELEDLKDKVDRFNKEVPKALASIEKAVGEIKVLIEKNSELGDKDNAMIRENIKELERRTANLENNQNKFVWTFIVEFIGLLCAAVLYYIQIKP